MKKLLLLTLLTQSTATASSYDDGVQICKNLKIDIARNYNVKNLELMINGNPYVSESLVSCTYRASVSEMYGDRPTMVTALLNTSNNRFTIEIQ